MPEKEVDIVYKLVGDIIFLLSQNKEKIGSIYE